MSKLLKFTAAILLLFAIVCQSFAFECEIESRGEGNCVKIDECPSMKTLKNNFKNLSPALKSFVKESLQVCESAGDDLYCCISKEKPAKHPRSRQSKSLDDKLETAEATPEASPECETKSYGKGRCVAIKQCQSMEAMKKKFQHLNSNDKNILKEAFQACEDELVCCSDRTEKKISNNKANEPRKSSSSCDIEMYSLKGECKLLNDCEINRKIHQNFVVHNNILAQNYLHSATCVLSQGTFCCITDEVIIQDLNAKLKLQDVQTTQKLPSTTASTTRKTTTTIKTTTTKKVEATTPSFVEIDRSKQVDPTCLSPNDQNLIESKSVKKADQHPWMAALVYQADGGKSMNILCSGTIIAKRFILTSASCVSKIAKNKLHSVKVGILDENGNCAANSGCEEIRVHLKLVHNSYSPNSRSELYDVAVLRLARNIRFTQHIQPICLPYGQQQSFDAGHKMKSIEFASMSNRKISELISNLEVVDLRQCGNTYSVRTEEESQICTNSTDNQRSLQVKSGGAILNCQTGSCYQAGVLSFGATEENNKKGLPRVYTLLSDSFLEWIKETVKEYK